MISCIQLFATLWTLYCLAPLSMAFSRQEYYIGLLVPPSGDLPGITRLHLLEPCSSKKRRPCEPPGNQLTLHQSQAPGCLSPRGPGPPPPSLIGYISLPVSSQHPLFRPRWSQSSLWLVAIAPLCRLLPPQTHTLPLTWGATRHHRPCPLTLQGVCFSDGTTDGAETIELDCSPSSGS